MSENTIACLRDAVRHMASGDFKVDIPVSGEGLLGELGQALADLADGFERRLRQIATLSEITRSINEGFFLTEVLDHVYDSFRKIIPYDRIGFSVLEDEGQTLRAQWARSEAKTIRLAVGYSAPMKGSSLEAVMRTKKPRILNDLVEYSKRKPDSESTRLILLEGMRSSLTCPLIIEGKPIGFMFFSSTTPHAYANAHVELFTQIAGQLASVLEKGRLYDKLGRSHLQLTAAHKGLQEKLQELNQANETIRSLRQILATCVRDEHVRNDPAFWDRVRALLEQTVPPDEQGG